MNVKINDKAIMKIARILALLAFGASLAWLVLFLNNNVYATIMADSSSYQDKINVNVQNLDANKFDRIIADMSKKSQKKDIEIVNLFP